ncbi:MAG: carbamoyltransferase N-terminal domain-containing protein [Bdellovibrionales bacterium]
MSSPLISLGLSLGQRAGAAVLMHPKGVVASAVEERMSNRRPALPLQAIQFCLNQAGVKDLSSVDVISLQSRHARDWVDFLANQFAEEKSWIEGLLSLPANLRHELRFRAELRRELAQLGGEAVQLPEVVLVADEQAIVQGLYSQKPMEDVGFLLFDMPFAKMATGLWVAREKNLESIWLQEFPQSLELLVANLAGFCGFRGRMGQRQFLQLSEYGDPRFVEMLKTELFQIEESARFRVNNDILVMEPNLETDWTRLDPLIQDGPRRADQPISSREIDLAHSLVVVLHEWIDEVGRFALEDMKLQQLNVRGQGPLFDRMKSKWRRLPLNCQLLGLQDEPLLMAAGAAREALVSKGVQIDSHDPLNLRPQSAFQEYLRRASTNPLN